METIIVPLDFTLESLAGLNYALMLANKMQANILMVHVMEKDDDANTEQKGQTYKLAKLEFEEIIQKYVHYGHSIGSFTYTIKEGKIFEEVISLAAGHKNASIILSTYTEAGFGELTMGDNAYRIISHSSVPVITVRSGKTPSTIHKIVLPLDITFQTREKVPFTIKLAKLFNAEIHLVSVRMSNIKSIEEKLEQYANQVAAYIANQSIQYTIKHLQGDNLTDITLDYAMSVDADFISMMTEQEKSLSNLIHGSYAHQMISKASIPVLAFPNYPLQIITEDIWDLGAFNPRS